MNPQTSNNLTKTEGDKKRDLNKLNADEANVKYMRMKRAWENEFDIFIYKTEVLIYPFDIEPEEQHETLLNMSEKIDEIRTRLFNRQKWVLDMLVC